MSDKRTCGTLAPYIMMAKDQHGNAIVDKADKTAAVGALP